MSEVYRELKTVARLSLPVVLTQIGMMLTGVVDTMMVGRLGVRELAASALANMWQWTLLSFALGVVMGIDPLISQAHGRGDGAGAARALQAGVVLALVVSVPVTAGMALTEPALVLLGQDPAIAHLSGIYNFWKLATPACFLVYSAMRQYLQGRTLMSAATWVIWIANVAHVALNYALIFGRLGAPALGLAGAAIATSVTVFLMVLGLWLWIVAFRLHEDAWVPWDRESLAPRRLWRAARLGLSVGAQVALEAWAFSIATMMAGWLGTREVSGNQVVLNLASLAFMVPLGVAQGASARVGNLVGAQDLLGMRRAVRISLVLGAGVMCLSASVFTLARFELPRLYTSDPEVIALAAGLLPIAAAFQLSDGTQVVAGGLLRGMARPERAAMANLLGYYAVGLPLGYLLGFRFHLGLVGIWLGLVAGLTVVAGTLLVWVRSTSRRPLSELAVSTD